MEQGSMERSSRLPSAPSRLPQMTGGVRVQSSGLPRLFGRIPVPSVHGNDPGLLHSQETEVTATPSPTLHPPPPKQVITAEDQEWYSWIGKKVCISGIKKGVLMYYGKTHFAEGMFCGISLDEEEGKHDGELNGHRYFTCPNKHGVFAPISKVEKVLPAKLPPISSPPLSAEDVHRTITNGKSSVLSNNFTKEKLTSGYDNGFTNAFVRSPSTCNGGLNEKCVPVKSQSFGSDLNQTYNMKESPTNTYPFQKTYSFHRNNKQSQSSQKSFICEEPQLACYEEDDSSLGLLTDSQMGDFSIEGLLLMPKTQSCDDINELPEHEVVQDITVQYLDENMVAGEAVPFHSSSFSRSDVKQASLSLEHSTSDDRSVSMLVDQEFPSLAFDCTIGTATEDKTPTLSETDATKPLVPAEMPEEVVTPQFVPDLKCESSSSFPADCLATSKTKCDKTNTEVKPKTSPVPAKTETTSGLVEVISTTGERIMVSREAMIGALVGSISKSANLPEDLIAKLSSSLRDASTMETTTVVVENASAVKSGVQVVSPTDVLLQDKSQKSLESSLTKSVEWNDVVMVQHSNEECKEERLSIEKVMEVIQAKGHSGQRPASTYTVGSADTGYQGDGEFDLHSEIETASPCEEMKHLMSPSVSTSLSLDDMNASTGGTVSSKMGKSGHLSDSDFFTEDPGEAEGGTCTPPIMKEETDQPSESADGSAACVSVADETIVEQAPEVTVTLEQETEVEDTEVPSESVCTAETEVGESAETQSVDTIAAATEDVPKKSKKLPHSGPVKKVVGVSKIKAMLESQPSVEQPKRPRPPKKQSRWDAVTSKIQAGMAEEKVKPRREIRGRVDTNLVAARTVPPPPPPPPPPAPAVKKGDSLSIKLVANEGTGSAGPASTRSTPVTESFNLHADLDETASQAPSAKGACSLVSSCTQCAPDLGTPGTHLSSSTASAFSSAASTSSHCSVLSSIPSTSQHHSFQNSSTTRIPFKIPIRLQPRLDTVAKICDQTKATSRQARSTTLKPQKAGVQASKGASSSTSPQTQATPVGSRNASAGRTAPVIRNSYTSSNPLVIPSSSRQQRQKLEELWREVQHLGALCESRTKELNRVKMQLKHAASGFDAFATLVQYLAGELNAFSHPDLISEIQTTKEQLITLESFLKQCEGDLEGMKERHAEEVNMLTRQLQQAQEDTALLQEKLENAEKIHLKQCEEWEQEKERILKEAGTRQQAALEITQAQHTSQVEALSKDHEEEVKACEERHKVEQEALQGQLELMKERCRKLQEQATSIEEALQKDTNSKIQWLSAKNADLQKEVESLKSVLEMKQEEVHELRKDNQVMNKQAEEVTVYRQRVSKLMTRIEELQALLREKAKKERKLSCDQRSLQEHLDKESKINRQLSMEKEELLWRLTESFNNSTGSPNNTLLVTPDLLRMKRPIASTPFRLTPGSLPPFRENISDEQAPQQANNDENLVSSTSSLDSKPHRAKVRVNRTRSCHTSPRDSPSHNSSSRMVVSTPNMPCDDDNNSVDDPTSSAKLSPCDSLTELHLKACMQLDCIDDILLQQQQQDDQVFSPNGASSPNSGSVSMTSSAAEDLSLSSTEEERRLDHLITVPRIQAGEAMSAIDEKNREAMATPDSPPGERVEPPSDNNLSDTPCFCDDFDISSEPE